MTSPHPRRCALEFEALPIRIGQARRIVSAQLRHWRLDPVLDTVLLGVTELLANVHRHAEPDKHCTVELSCDADRLTVAVTDLDPRPPLVGPPADPLDTHGRGLALLEALTDSWGSGPDARGGKVVWFTLSAPAAPAPFPVIPAEAPARSVVTLPAEPRPAAAVG